MLTNPGGEQGGCQPQISGTHARGCRGPRDIREKPNFKGPKAASPCQRLAASGSPGAFLSGSPASESLPRGGAGFQHKRKGLGLGLPLAMQTTNPSRDWTLLL